MVIHSLRVLAGNSILEDINDYSKCAEFFENVMKPDQDRQNDDVENFGYHLGDGQTLDSTNAPGIEAAKRKIVLYNPINQNIGIAIKTEINTAKIVTSLI